MATIVEIPGPLSTEQTVQVHALLDAVTERDAHPALGEQKRTQMDQGADGWTALLAVEANELVGYAHVRWDAPGHTPRASAEIIRHPEHRKDDAMGTALIQHIRDAMVCGGGGTLFVWTFHVNDPSDTLPAHAGLYIQRRLLIMSATFDDAPAHQLSDGLRIAPFRPDQDVDAFLEVNNAAFATHPEQGGWTRETMESRMALDWFDPDGLLMAWDQDTPLGFHWTKRHPDGRGEVYVIGVHPNAQGRGLGKSLLHAGIAHLHDHDVGDVFLYVDSASESAVKLYEAAGFEVAHSDICYAEDVPPAGSSL